MNLKRRLEELERLLGSTSVITLWRHDGSATTITSGRMRETLKEVFAGRFASRDVQAVLGSVSSNEKGSHLVELCKVMHAARLAAAEHNSDSQEGNTYVQ